MEEIKDYIIDKWDDLIRFFPAKYQMLKRMLFWGWNMRKSYDFDAATIYEVLYLKLNRIYVCFVEDSHCVWNSDINNKYMRELRVAIELSKRLSNDTYITHMNIHYEKWGEPIFDFENGSLDIVYPKVITKEDKVKHRKEFKVAMNKDNKQCQSDQKELFRLLDKNINYWWD